MMRWRWHIVLLLGVLLTVAGVLLSARQSPAEKYGNCLPLAAGACARIVLPADAGTLSPSCTQGELAIKTSTTGGCTTAPCLCMCNAPNTWTCLNNN